MLVFKILLWSIGSIYSHCYTPCVWPHRPGNPPRRPRARRISPWRSPSLFPYFTLTPSALMLEHQLLAGPADSIY